MEILLLLLIASLFLNRKPSNYLMCGLFAWTGDSPKKFSWDKFNILGMYNDSRGGDSCGRIVNGEVLYGLNTKKYYAELIQLYTNDTVKETVVLGHSRKASWGYAVNKDNAQPIIIEEDGEVTFVLTHNGTIINVDELRNLYPIVAPQHKTDSYVLAHIIYKYGFEVLSKYQGTAALIMYDRRKYLENGDHVLYVFKGASKEYTTSIVESEERPLHVYNKGNNSLYFSSEQYPLHTIGGDLETVEEILPNIVYTIKNGQLDDDILEVDRSKCGQYKKYPGSRTNGKPYQNYSELGYDYDGYVDHNDAYYPERLNSEHNSYGGAVQLDDDVLSSAEDKSVKVIYKKGLYHILGSPAKGCFHLNAAGNYFTKKGDDRLPFYFIDGVMIRDHQDFRLANIEYNKLTNNEKTGVRGVSILSRYSSYPMWVKIGGNVGHLKNWHFKKSEMVYYSGDLKPAFSRYHYKVNTGTILSSMVVGESRIVIPASLSLLSDKNEYFEEPFTNDLDMIKQEITHELAVLLSAITTARENLNVAGEGTVNVDILVKNLAEIERIILAEDDNIFNKDLSITPKWENPK